MAEETVKKTLSQAKPSQRNVWIFQGNPLTYDVYSSLIDENLKEAAWLINRYKDEIHAGDIALIWKARQGSGIYALGDIVTDPELMYDLDESKKYWKSSDGNKKALRVKIRYRLRLRLTTALSRKELRTIPGLSNMEIFKQAEGTNFKVQPSEWQIIRNLLNERCNFKLEP